MEDKKLEERIAKQHADQLRRAMNSAETTFKSYFRKFCTSNGAVKGDPWWKQRIIPQRDVDAIMASFRNSLDKYGIDINTAQLIPSEIFSKIMAESKEALERVYDEIEKQLAVKDLNELLKYDKPLVWAEKLTIYGNYYESFYDGEGSQHSRYEWPPNKGASGDILSRIKPMNAVGEIGYSKDHHAAIENITINDVVKLSNGHDAIITDDAIFMSWSSGAYLYAMADQYQNYLEEHGMDVPILGGREGYDAILKCYEQRRIELSNEINLSNASNEEKYQMVSDLLKGMQATGSYIAICDNKDSPSVCIINEDGNYERVGFEEVQPGMNVLCGGNEFKDMEAGDTLDGQSCFKVVHTIEIDDTTVLVTDRGIIANRDIGEELGIEQEREYAHEI